MTKSIKFLNKLDGVYYEELPRSEDLFTLTPMVFQNSLDDNASVALCDPFGTFTVKGETKPRYYMRHALIDEYRFGGVIELGDGPLDYQIGGDCDDFFQRGAIQDTYRKLDDRDGSFTYGFGTESPFSQFRLHNDYATFKEGDNVLDIKAEFINNAIVDHQASFENLPQIFFPSKWSGTYRGKEINGLGFYCMNYKLASTKGSILASLGYISLSMLGIREDGRYEMAFVAIDQTGTAGAFYKLEGEPLVSSNEVIMEADWYRLPYVDDGTCVFKDATFKFKDKTIHFKGMWGSKGITPKPRVEKHGQSHIFGTWYEGDQEYTHQSVFAFSENMEAYDVKLEKLGFEIKDVNEND